VLPLRAARLRRVIVVIRPETSDGPPSIALDEGS
jgi:hypothetical protein